MLLSPHNTIFISILVCKLPAICLCAYPCWVFVFLFYHFFVHIHMFMWFGNVLLLHFVRNVDKCISGHLQSVICFLGYTWLYCGSFLYPITVWSSCRQVGVIWKVSYISSSLEVKKNRGLWPGSHCLNSPGEQCVLSSLDSWSRCLCENH